MTQLILALPAYNEAETMDDLLAEAVDALDGLDRQVRVIVSDDGSSDDTASKVRAFRAPFPVEAIENEVNRGLGPNIIAVLRRALEHSDNPDDAIVCMDADFTHPVGTVPAMSLRDCPVSCR